MKSHFAFAIFFLLLQFRADAQVVDRIWGIRNATIESVHVAQGSAQMDWPYIEFKLANRSISRTALVVFPLDLAAVNKAVARCIELLTSAASSFRLINVALGAHFELINNPEQTVIARDVMQCTVSFTK